VERVVQIRHFEVWSTFTMHYAVKDAPSGLLFYEIKWSNWEHHNSEFVHGQYNVLKMIEILEAEIASCGLLRQEGSGSSPGLRGTDQFRL